MSFYCGIERIPERLALVLFNKGKDVIVKSEGKKTIINKKSCRDFFLAITKEIG